MTLGCMTAPHRASLQAAPALAREAQAPGSLPVGASALLGVGRVMWATDDPWGGPGHLIRWSDPPAMQGTRARPCLDPELEAAGARLFAPGARRAFAEGGWAVWCEPYPGKTAGLE